MKPVLSNHRKPLLLLLAVIALRSIIPAGYMPGSLDSGLLFVLCPDGMPSAFMQELVGHDHHGSSAGETGPHSFAQCTMGHLLGSMAFAAIEAANPSVAEKAELVVSFQWVLSVTTRLNYYSRAPPAYS